VCQSHTLMLAPGPTKIPSSEPSINFRIDSPLRKSSRLLPRLHRALSPSAPPRSSFAQLRRVSVSYEWKRLSTERIFSFPEFRPTRFLPKSFLTEHPAPPEACYKFRTILGYDLSLFCLYRR
jgi:hypothetical protein